MDKKIRVLIIDDSSLMREALSSIISSDSALEVVGVAKDGLEGVRKVAELKPDVITMDLKMPIMSGFDAIERIMEHDPVSIIVVSSMDDKVVFKALSIGAMDFVAVTEDTELIAKDLIEKIKISSKVKPIRRMKIKLAAAPASFGKNKDQAFKVIAVGVSTGGPQALNILIPALPIDFPAGILVVQHMTAGFIKGLGEWLRFNSGLEIKVAASGDRLKAGQVLFAPDGYNTRINRNGEIMLSKDVSGKMLHVPSIDVMMESAAQSYGKNAVGVLMTGMGSDGVLGLKAIKAAGGITIAQDESTSAIYGMNKVAAGSGCVDNVLPLNKIAEELVRIAFCA